VGGRKGVPLDSYTVGRWVKICVVVLDLSVCVSWGEDRAESNGGKKVVDTRNERKGIKEINA